MSRGIVSPSRNSKAATFSLSFQRALELKAIPVALAVESGARGMKTVPENLGSANGIGLNPVLSEILAPLANMRHGLDMTKLFNLVCRCKQFQRIYRLSAALVREISCESICDDFTNFLRCRSLRSSAGGHWSFRLAGCSLQYRSASKSRVAEAGFGRLLAGDRPDVTGCGGVGAV